MFKRWSWKVVGSTHPQICMSLTLDHPVPPSPTFWTLEWPYLFHLQHIHYISVWQDTYFVLFKLLIKFVLLKLMILAFSATVSKFQTKQGHNKHKPKFNVNISSRHIWQEVITLQYQFRYKISIPSKFAVRENKEIFFVILFVFLKSQKTERGFVNLRIKKMLA